MSQRRLSDLRKLREVVPFEGEDDGEPYEIKVWVVKLNDDDHESCLRAADAAKARTMIDRNNRDSEQWTAAYGATLNLGDNTADLAEYLSHFHMAEKAVVIQAEVAGDENGKWGKDGYLDGLLDAWRGTEAGDLGLQLAWQARDDDPDTLDPKIASDIPEALRVYAELTLYEEAVEKKLDVERARYVREHKDDPIEELRTKVVETFLEKRANEVWIRAFERAQVFYATRDFIDEKTPPGPRYFQSPAEIADTDPEFRHKILLTYAAISVPSTEGKGSPGPQSSSPRSGSSGEEGTSEASGPTAASV